MSNKPNRDVCIAEENGDTDYFSDIVSAWLKDTGTMSVELRPNIAVSGRFIIVTKKDKAISH